MKVYFRAGTFFSAWFLEKLGGAAMQTMSRSLCPIYNMQCIVDNSTGCTFITILNGHQNIAQQRADNVLYFWGEKHICLGREGQ